MKHNGINGLVSIIMPTFNSIEFIEDTIQSVQQQTYTNWELIVVDDCSTDNTSEVLRNISILDKRVHCYKLHKNSGAAVSRNFGIEKARGEYIAFLDSDDLWFANKLDAQIKFMKKNNYSFTYTLYNKISFDGKDLNRIIKVPSVLDYHSLLQTCPGNSTVIYNANELGTKILIKPIRKRNDYLMWLEVIKISKKMYGLDEVLCSHRLRDNSLSKNKISLVKYHWEIYYKIEKLGLFKSLGLIVYWISKPLFKNDKASYM